MKANVAEIRSKYRQPPPLNEMLDFIQEAGMTYRGFEYYYGIPLDIIKSVKAGFKQLPVKYWPIFYEKIIPQYGVGLKKEIVSTRVSNRHTTQRKTPSKDNRLVVIE